MAKPIRAIERESVDIRTLNEHIRTREVLRVEIVNDFLRRIEQINPKLNAFITRLADQARDQARLASRDSRLASAPRLTCYEGTT